MTDSRYEGVGDAKTRCCQRRKERRGSIIHTYRAEKKGWYVVARYFFLALLSFSPLYLIRGPFWCGVGVRGFLTISQTVMQCDENSRCHTRVSLDLIINFLFIMDTLYERAQAVISNLNNVFCDFVSEIFEAKCRT